MSNRFLLFLNLAHDLSQRRGVPVAIMANGWDAVAYGAASTGALGSGTAIVNLLQNVHQRMDGRDIYSTYRPTDADLGMARICRIRSIYMHDGTNVQRYKPEEAVGSTGFTTAVPNSAEIKPVKVALVSGGTAIPINPSTGTVASTWFASRSNGVAWYDANGERAISSTSNAVPYTGVASPVLTAVPAVTRPVLAARGDATRESLFMTITYALLHATWDRTPTLAGNKVACILVDPSDRIVSWGINMAVGAGNPTWHGEIVTLRRQLTSLGTTTLGRGYKIYTTLKPCYMCAGMIAEVAPQGMTVIFGQDDPQITNSTLDRNVGRYSQKSTHILRSERESFPQLLSRLMAAANQTSAIPYLERMSPADRGDTFARTLPWSVRMDTALRNQHQTASFLDRELRTRGHRSNLAALDLAVPTPRQSHDHLWVLHQGLRLLKAVGAPVDFT